MSGSAGNEKSSGGGGTGGGGGKKKWSVKLHLYDLSNGMAAALSQQLLGRHFEGIWHSGLVYAGREWYFGGGIFHDQPFRTPYGAPVKVIELGETEVPPALFEDFVDGIRPRFRMQDYNLLSHNCNNFSNECSIFLLGKGIPRDIIDLPREALSTPLGQAILPAIQQYQSQMQQQFAGIDNSISAAASSAPGLAPNAHYHESLKLPLLQSAAAVLFVKGDAAQPVSRLAKVEALSADQKKALLSLAQLKGGQVAAAQIADCKAVVHTLLELSESLPLAERFPAIDLLRMLAFNQGAAQHMLEGEGPEVIRRLFNTVVQSKECGKGYRLTTMRLGANLAAVPQFRAHLVKNEEYGEVVGDAILHALNAASVARVVKQAASTFAYNVSLVLPKDSHSLAVHLISGIVHYLSVQQQDFTNPTLLTLVLTLGNIMYRNSEATSLVQALELDLKKFIQQQDNTQLRIAATQVSQVLNA